MFWYNIRYLTGLEIGLSWFCSRTDQVGTYSKKETTSDFPSRIGTCRETLHQEKDPPKYPGRVGVSVPLLSIFSISYLKNFICMKYDQV